MIAASGELDASSAWRLQDALGAASATGASRVIADFAAVTYLDADALAILASPAAARASSFEPALKSLFCATRSDWERFDEIFRAYWLGRFMRRARTVSGASAESRAPQRRVPFATPQGPSGLPDRVERREAADHEVADRSGRREGASRAELVATTDLRHIVEQIVREIGLADLSQDSRLVGEEPALKAKLGDAGENSREVQHRRRIPHVADEIDVSAAVGQADQAAIVGDEPLDAGRIEVEGGRLKARLEVIGDAQVEIGVDRPLALGRGDCTQPQRHIECLSHEISA